MLLPLPEPEPQFVDANGIPYAGGTITTYIPGTDTLAETWTNLEGTALNTNPIVLDAAGRALIYGAGDYRFVLKDAAGNLIYDQETSAIDKSTLVTMAEVNDAVQAETDRAEAAEAAETARAEAAEATLTANLNAEIARAEAAEAHLQSEIDGLSTGGTTPVYQSGYSITDSSGYVLVTFATAYTAPPVVVASVVGNNFDSVCLNVYPNATGFECRSCFADAVFGPTGFDWIAIGT